MSDNVTNIIIAGLGGQGVVRASDLLARAAFVAGFDVKKSELHGMSQRGGSVSSDVRFGEKVFSPMIPEGLADFLVVLSPSEAENSRPRLKRSGEILLMDEALLASLPEKRAANTALLGRLSLRLEIDEAAWQEALKFEFSEKLIQANVQAFMLGRKGAR
jgi:indolepyruvate ferredoxin oxidoreductase, beta subunit